jgi:single-stranded-DNA-specific exonuclease
MLKPKTRWDVKSTDEKKASELAKQLEVPLIVARLLINRGIDTVAEAQSFLHIDNQAFFDPFLLDDMDKVVKRVNDAIAQNEKILIFGDYDADGVSSTTVMMKALLEKGANVDYYIPNRFTEGYGPNEKAFRWAKDAEYSLIITVDTGISANEQAKLANQLDMDLIITDHHELPKILPDCFAIIHPRKQGSKYPFGELAGVGVAFKVAHALLGYLPKKLLQFAAIGTIADLVPLRSENRLIASVGLQEIQNSVEPGIQELLKVCGTDDQYISEETVGFAIGPRINAAGRIDHADPAVELLLTDDREHARELAQEIDRLNRERQKIVNEITEEAVAMVETSFPPEENGALVIAKVGWNAGVIGIVASRLVERFYRPTIVLSIDPEEGKAKGSARSIAGFDLYKNLSTCRDILPHFGGHPMAAGMTLQADDVDELRDRLNELARNQLSDEDFLPITAVELECSIDEISLEVVEQIGLLAPFGVGNPKPVVLLKQVPFAQMRRIGGDGSHLKMVFQEEGLQPVDGIGFGFGHLCDQISSLSRVSAIGELTLNEWNGHRKPQVMIRDLAVDEWQLFDLRGTRQVSTALKNIPKENRIVVAFQRKTIEELKLHDEEIICLEDGHQINGELTDCSLVLLDLPTDKEELEHIIRDNMPARIYTVFYHEEDHFFSTIPTREHFRWFYGFLMKQKQLNLKKHADLLAQRKGWSKQTVYFMTKVFLELKFVKINDGIVTIVEKPVKRDITDSLTFQQKQMQIEIEQDLIYSSFQTLREWFNEASGSLKFKEEIVQ